MTEGSGMSELEKVETASQPLAVGVKTQTYKSLLNQHAQKLWKHLPMYQTRNEGSAHEPKFRSTVWFDGVSYTSPNTFPQRKTAEMDASKIAFFATLQKLKDEASHLIREDKCFCKSILVEYAARMNIGKPAYQTSQLDMSVPVFSSSLDFNNVVYTGEVGRSKKEAEQSAARAVILKYLDSESGNILSEIIMSKFKNYAKMKETHNGTNTMLQAAPENGIPLSQATMPGISTQAIIPVPTVLASTPSAGTNDAPTSSAISAPCLGHIASILATHLSSNVTQPASSGALVGLTSSKKRNRKNKKKAQKKMRVEAQSPIPAVPLSQVPTFSAQ